MDRTHRHHDRLLVVALATGDLLPDGSRRRAETLTSGCTDCREVGADVMAIRAALICLPAPVRRRDFRLDDRTAAACHPTRQRLGAWLLRPLGGALVAAGLALAMVLPTGVAEPGTASPTVATGLMTERSLRAMSPSSLGADPITANSSAADASTTDVNVMDTATGPSAVDAGTADTGAAVISAVDTGVALPGAADPDTADISAADAGTTDARVMAEPAGGPLDGRWPGIGVALVGLVVLVVGSIRRRRATWPFR